MNDNYSNNSVSKLCGKTFGSRVVILGKGPSLTLVNRDLLPFFTTIGINDIYKYYSSLDHLFFMDGITFKENEKQFIELKKKGTSLWTFVKDTPYIRLSMEGSPYAFVQNKFHHGFTSAFVALQMAVWAGAKEVYLAGVDFRPCQKGDYWDGTKAREGKGFPAHLQKMVEGFKVAHMMERIYDFKIFHIAGSAALDFIPIRSLEQALKYESRDIKPTQ